MKIIDDLIDSLTNPSNTLTDSLIKTKILAFKLKNQELQDWIENELNGYGDKEIPDYRIIPCEITGVISNGVHRMTNYPIPLISLDADLKKKIKTVNFYQSISILDEFISNKESNKMFINIPASMYSYLSKDFDSGFAIEYARQEINQVQLIQAFTVVKSKLINFLLKLNEAIGDENISNFKTNENRKKVSSLFSSSVFGDNTTIFLGDNNKQIVKNITVGDFDSLKKQLINDRIDENDLNELEKIIATDNPDLEKKQFGAKVKEWISTMIIKSMDGTWKIGIDAAGKILADAIRTYYGWK